MRFIKKWGFLFAVTLIFLVSLGYIVFLVGLIITGEKAQGIVIHKTFDEQRSNITVEYQVDGETYSFKRLYGRNIMLRVNDNVSVFYPKDNPEKGYISKDLGVVPFICVVSGIMIYLLRPKRENDYKKLKADH